MAYDLRRAAVLARPSWGSMLERKAEGVVSA